MTTQFIKELYSSPLSYNTSFDSIISEANMIKIMMSIKRNDNDFNP